MFIVYISYNFKKILATTYSGVWNQSKAEWKIYLPIVRVVDGLVLKAYGFNLCLGAYNFFEFKLQRNNLSFLVNLEA